MAILIGGQRREIRVTLDPARLAAYNLDARCRWPARWARPTGGSRPGGFPTANREVSAGNGEFLRTAEDVRNVVVGVANGKPVFVRDVARGDRRRRGAFAIRAVRLAEKAARFEPAVTLAIAKRKGTNAIDVAEQAFCSAWSALKGTRDPVATSKVTITRNYGETAAEKSNELLLHMVHRRRSR